MPEGHSIHRLARRHRRLLAGHPVAVTSPQGRFAEAAATIDGQVLSSTDAWGKHLFHRYDDLWVHVHLGLFGRFGDGRGEPPEARGALRMRLVVDDAWADLRGPTACELMDDSGRAALLDRLGPDPLRPDADPSPAVAKVVRSRRTVGDLLLDQSVLAGVGNVYRAEVLFRHGVDPFTPGRDLDPGVVEAMWHDLVVLMEAGVSAGRIVTTEPEDRERPAGRARRVDSSYVYGRAGLPCRRCRSVVRRAELGARTVFWCPVCQA